jgi:hypothetical protein
MGNLTLGNLTCAQSGARLVIGRGTAGSWSHHASAVIRGDDDLLRLAQARLFRMGLVAGLVTRDGTLIGDAWLLVIGSVDDSTLDADPSVTAYCEVQP